MISKAIVFVSASERSSSTRYRAFQYFPYLRLAGWTPAHISAESALTSRFHLLKIASHAEVVVVQRKTFAGWYLRLLRKAAKNLIFDFDDAIFLRSDGTASRTRLKRFVRLVKACDQVWAGNEHLAQYSRDLNGRVALLPTSVVVEEYDPDVKKPADTIDLVWIGSRSTKKHLQTLLPTLEWLAGQVGNLRLKIIADFTVPEAKIPIVPVEWSLDNEARELASSHIGIAPMPDDLWTRGKCGLKVLQYMAASLPVVASSCGVHPEMVQHGRSGLLADSLSEWRDALLLLATDRVLARKMGEAGRERVTRYFSTTATFSQMLASLEALEEPKNGHGDDHLAR